MYPGHVRVLMFIVIIFIIAVIGILDTLSFGSFPDKRFERFGPLYIPPHKKQHMRKNDVPVPVDDSRMCPLGVFYDADVHDALGNLRKLDGAIPVHPQYGMSVNFFAPKKSRKFWTKPSTAELGYIVPYF